MSDLFPVFELTPMTQSHLNHMILPLIESINNAQSVDVLIQWVSSVLPGNEEVIASLNTTQDVNAAKQYIIQYIAVELLNSTGKSIQTITPWDLHSTRTDVLTQFFGPVTQTLLITVNVGQHQHLMSQDLAFGIVLILYNHQQFKLLLDDYELTINEMAIPYMTSEQNIKTYQLVTSIGDITFNGAEVVQGIITAAQWLNVDPHTLVDNLRENTAEGQVLLNF